MLNQLHKEKIQKNIVKVCLGEYSGTAFWIAPEYLMTCAHVVRNHENINLSQNGHSFNATVDYLGGSNFDVAILKTETKCFEEISFIEDLEHRANLYMYGYEANSNIGTERTLSFEGFEGFKTIVTKDAQILHGFSGSPLIDEMTSSIIGIVTKSRLSSYNEGAKALSLKYIIENLPSQYDFLFQSFNQRSQAINKAFNHISGELYDFLKKNLPNVLDEFENVKLTNNTNLIIHSFDYRKRKLFFYFDFKKQISKFRKYNVIDGYQINPILIQGFTKDTIFLEKRILSEAKLGEYHKDRHVVDIEGLSQIEFNVETLWYLIGYSFLSKNVLFQKIWKDKNYSYLRLRVMEVITEIIKEQPLIISFSSISPQFLNDFIKTIERILIELNSALNEMDGLKNRIFIFIHTSFLDIKTDNLSVTVQEKNILNIPPPVLPLTRDDCDEHLAEVFNPNNFQQDGYEVFATKYRMIDKNLEVSEEGEPVYQILNKIGKIIDSNNFYQNILENEF